MDAHVYPNEAELLHDERLVKTGVPYPPRLVEIRKKARAEGLSVRAIAAKVGVGIGTVHRVIKGEHVSQL
jgi:hypothetical protein